MRVPAAVRDAIQNFVPGEGMVVLPQASNQSSVIFSWGVRIQFIMSGDVHFGWVCLASQSCRENFTVFKLASAKTSKATKHLRDDHGIVSYKTQTECDRKRSRDEESERLQNSILYKTDPSRIRLLLETLRIVNHNLPFRLGEYDESILLNEIAIKESFRVPLSSRLIAHSIAELYVSAKREVTTYLSENRIKDVASLSMVTDFWTSKTKGEKFLGMRVYLIDEEWKFESVLLGIRHFNPSFGDRDCGIRRPFKSWIDQVLMDFGLTVKDFFGATSDGGKDVQWMMEKGLHLKREWCIPHLTNAATKMASGISSSKETSNNPEMTELIARISKTVYQVRHVEKMGTLFADLCALRNNSKSSQLLDFQCHRFLGLAVVIRRILEKWGELELWYQARIQQATREKKRPPCAFPLMCDKTTLTQLLSMLDPINILNKKSQAESVNQVEVLLSLYRLRLTVLDLNEPLQDYQLNQATYYDPVHLTSTALKTRILLNERFHANFFVRYSDTAGIRSRPFVFESQMLLHPVFKSMNGLDQIVQRVNSQQGVAHGTIYEIRNKLREEIKKRVKCMMISCLASTADTLIGTSSPGPTVYSEELVEMFAPRSSSSSATSHWNVDENRVEEELQRWMADESQLQRTEDGSKESVLSFWRRQAISSNYQILPKVVRILFSVPASSAQIERDFGISGSMVSPQRTSLSPQNIDMSCFLSRNSEFVDVTQCHRLKAEEVEANKPSHVTVGFDEDENGDQEFTSSFLASISNDAFDDEEF